MDQLATAPVLFFFNQPVFQQGPFSNKARFPTRPIFQQDYQTDCYFTSELVPVNQIHRIIQLFLVLNLFVRLFLCSLLDFIGPKTSRALRACGSCMIIPAGKNRREWAIKLLHIQSLQFK